MSRGLSERQQQVLALLAAHLRQSGRAPALRELGEQLGGVSAAAVHLQLAALAHKGYLRWPPGRPREVELLHPSQSLTGLGLWRVPVVGTIAAGAPIDAAEVPEGYVVVEAAQVHAGAGEQERSLYALRVKGDSMVDACIQDGDVVVVRRQSTAEDGDTVVALLEGERTTLKRLYHEAGRIRLEPANPYYPALYVTDVRIQGKVVGVVRYC